MWQKYLGRAEDIVTALSAEHSESAPVAKPTEAAVSEFGAVVALYDLAQRLELTAHIDRHVPKRGRGPSVGTYLLVAILKQELQVDRSLAEILQILSVNPFEKTLLLPLLTECNHNSPNTPHSNQLPLFDL